MQAHPSERERSHPGAAASLREGMVETLPLTRLATRGSPQRTLREALVAIARSSATARRPSLTPAEEAATLGTA